MGKKKDYGMDPRLVELVQRFAKAVEPLGLQYAVGGALAMGAHGVRRYTSDLDVFAPDASRAKLLSALRKAGFEVSDVMRPMHYVAVLRKHNSLDVRIDLLFPAGEPELSAVEHPVRLQIAGAEVNVFQAELLVATKFYSDRIEDELDIALMLHAGLFEPETVRVLIACIDPEGAKDFVKLIRRLKSPRKPPARPNRRM